MARGVLARCVALYGLLALAARPTLGLRFPPGKLHPYCGTATSASETVSTSSLCVLFPHPADDVDRNRHDSERPGQAARKSVDAVEGVVEAQQGLQDIFDALAVLQNTYWNALDGTWPTSIEWTGAVVGTIISGTLSTLTRSLGADAAGPNVNVAGNEKTWGQVENLISSVYAQVVHSFFGQNALAIKMQAYDDILWVVLGWLETVEFIRLHAKLHFPGTGHACSGLPRDLSMALASLPWQGYNWLCTFAARAREFWQLATFGWDKVLCGGGMIWNPRLTPYKNAITNELFIAGSVAMYQYYPRDDEGASGNTSWVSAPGFAPSDPAYLAAAVEGYRWLKGINMTNAQGLFVDGYHIDGSKPNNVVCDMRDEMVYTYNQGVILSGQRGLWAVTGSVSYLQEGHALVQAVIRATGWDIVAGAPVDAVGALPPGQLLPPWRGLGRGGILEEMCDASGDCSQDGQTFKGIFFHHLTAFCALVEAPADDGDVLAHLSKKELTTVREVHGQKCAAYRGWVEHNARAALSTRDTSGRFGMWWGAHVFGQQKATPASDGIDHKAPNMTDYRNHGTPRDALWGSKIIWQPGDRTGASKLVSPPPPPPPPSQPPPAGSNATDGDPNDRGRGRTVETQAGGLAVLRAYWELAQQMF